MEFGKAGDDELQVLISKDNGGKEIAVSHINIDDLNTRDPAYQAMSVTDAAVSFLMSKSQ